MRRKDEFYFLLFSVLFFVALLFTAGNPINVFAEEETPFALPTNVSRAISECLVEMNSGQSDTIQKGEQRLQNICNLLSDPEHETPRIEAEKHLAAVLNEPENQAARRWIVRMLARIGSEECVESLRTLLYSSMLLSSENLVFEETIATLAQIPNREAGDVLRGSLEQADKTNNLTRKTAIVSALGFREESESVEPLIAIAELFERTRTFDDLQIALLMDRSAIDDSDNLADNLANVNAVVSLEIQQIIQRKELDTNSLLALGRIGTSEASEQLQRLRFSALTATKFYFGPPLIDCAIKMMQKGQNRESLMIFHYLQRGTNDISGVQIATANGILQIASSSENIQYLLFLFDRAEHDRILVDVCAQFLWETHGNTAQHILPEDDETRKAVALLKQYEHEKRVRSLRSKIRDSSIVDSLSVENQDDEKEETKKADVDKNGESNQPRIMEKEVLAAENLLKRKRLERFFQFPTEFQVMLLKTLGERKDTSLFPFVEKALGSSDPRVRAAAMEALAFVGNENSISFLLEQLSQETNDDSQMLQKIKYGLKRTTISGADETISNALATALKSDSNIPLQNSLLEIAVARYLSLYYSLFQDAINSDDASTRQLAALGLGTLAQESDLLSFLKMLLQNDDGNKRTDIEKIVVQILEKSEDREYAVASVFNFYEKSDPQHRSAFFGLLRRIGGKKAFEMVLAAMRADNVSASAKESAFENLCLWPDATAMDELYRFSTKLVNKDLAEKALRGYVRLLALPSERTLEESLFLFQKAMEQAQKKETKEEILLQAASLRSEETLNFLLPYIGNVETRNGACEAILKLAQDAPFRTSHRRQLNPVLNAIMRNADTREMSEHARSLLK